MGQTYYIDPHDGSDTNRGLTQAEPFKTCAHRTFLPGDTILFKRGSVFREMLSTCNGSEHGPVTYGAYGQGSKPVFLGSISSNDPHKWIQDQPSIWRYTGIFPSEVCNLVFNEGESCGHLRWNVKDLKKQGQWHYTAIGVSTVTQGSIQASQFEHGVLYLFSSQNPAKFYSNIECVLWGQRRLVSGQRYVVLEDLAFRNSGVHGFQDCRVDHIMIRRCDFEFIGGAVWSRDRRIRFGNAIEFWDGARDCVVEDCIFKNIYDSGVTHQGGQESDVPERVYFRNNLFVNCGMASYECRGPAAREIYFENNTCVHAGGELSMQGEVPPRQSELYPEPMGHHVFIWRMDQREKMGSVYIRNNIFYESPHGAAIYSTIHPEDEKNYFVLDNNCYYQTMGNLLCRMKGRNYSPSEFPQYQTECDQDAKSLFADPRFINEMISDYRLQKETPCPNAGKKC
jgi:hypothetical protein